MVAFGYPMLAEQASGPCAAVEFRVASAIGAGSGTDGGSVLASAMLRAMVSGSNGQLAAGLVKQGYPNLPPTLGCAVFYWQTLFNPNILNALHARRQNF
jgi:hypothetical protein